jgi:hypothetical protein
MDSQKHKLIQAIAAILAITAGASDAQAADSLVASSSKVVNGNTYLFQKYLNADGRLYARIFENGIEVKAEPQTAKTIVSPTLLERLAKLADIEQLKVNLSIIPAETSLAAPAEQGGAFIKDGNLARLELNGKAVSQEQFLALDAETKLKLTSEREARVKTQSAALQRFADRYGFAGSPELKQALEEGYSSVTLSLTAATLRKLIETKDPELAGLELYFAPKDVIDTAMVATNINPWQQADASAQGDNVGIYMTESGCADEAGRTDYDRLAGSQTNHSQNVFGILRAVSPQAYIYCRGGAVLPANSDIDGVGGNPAIHVINRSNGGNYTTTYSLLDRDWDNFSYDNRIAIFNAAGNEGGATNTIISPAKGINVIAVGNYDDSTNTINASSSYLDPETKTAKPELSAPGTDITAGGFTMTGTSMASPHAAAMAADMISKYSFYRLRPQVVNAVMIGGATDAISGGKDKVGVGGIDFLSAAYNGWHYYYQGGNGAFNTFDQGDGATDSYITKKVTISNGWKNVRVAIAWQNRGTFTYDHKADAHPIGQDLDLTVYGPTGAYVGGSISWDNAYETVNFTPTVSGTYTIKIKRYANRDNGADFRMGLLINTY